MRGHVVALALAAAFGVMRPCAAEDIPTAAQWMDDLMWGRGPIGGPFALTDATGVRRTDAAFRGKLVVLYFGYTFCPDICPTDLFAIAKAIELLGPKGDMVQPVFVTIDPDRDTPAILADYVAAFHTRLIGLTGSTDEIATVTRAYKAWFAKAPGRAAGDYSIDHTGVIYLIGRDGKYLGFLPPQTTPERIAEALRTAL